jgi:hypothetical protein
MKKILLSISLFIYIFIPEKSYSQSKKIFCLDITEYKYHVIQEEKALEQFTGDRCKEWQKKYFSSDYTFEIVEISEKDYENATKPLQNKLQENTQKTSNEKNHKTKEANKTNISLDKIKINETKFLKKCEGGVFSSGYKKGTKEFDDCIIREEKLADLDQQKQQLINEEKNKKLAKTRESAEEKTREANAKLAKMTPDDRRAYTCSEKFGFRKGSDNFKDCVFKIYSAEIELEKLELQKQLAKANADLARANTDRQDRLALAQTETARMQAYAAQQQAISANTSDSLALIESGLRMMSPQRSAPAPMRTCSFNGRFMNCF